MLPHVMHDTLAYGSDVLSCDICKQDSELVAAKPRHDVVLADAALKALCCLFQNPVASDMTERIVHIFKLVQINKQQSAGRTIF